MGTGTTAAQIIAMVLQGSNIVTTLAPIALGVALQLKELFSKSGTDFTVEIKVFQDGAILDADATLEMIEAWKKANGYE